MGQAKNKGKNGKKGFGSMEGNKQREASSRGGHASAKGNTSNRGFASMDKEKQREISIRGGKASQHGPKNPRGATGRNQQQPSVKSEQHENRNRNEIHEPQNIADDIEISEKDLNALDEDEKIERSLKQASYSETDEDEDEGLGDGNIGRSTRSPGSDEEK